MIRADYAEAVRHARADEQAERADGLALTVPEYQGQVAAHLRALFHGADVAVRATRAAYEAILRDGRFKTAAEATPDRPMLAERLELERRAYTHGPGVIYGYLETPGSRVPRPALDAYGDVRFVLRRCVRERVTVTIHDSLLGLRDATVLPAPINEPHALCNIVGFSPWEWRSVDPDTPILSRASYIEAQIHGGLTLDDVERVAA